VGQGNGALWVKVASVAGRGKQLLIDDVDVLQAV
jgi:hypothetical protein